MSIPGFKLTARIAGLISIIILLSCSNEPEYSEVSDKLQVYPNPTVGPCHIFVPNDDGQGYQLMVFDPRGENVFDVVGFDIDIDATYTTDLTGPDGTYQVVLEVGSTSITRKIIKL